MARTLRTPVTPAVLRWAREEAGLSVAQTAKRAGVKAEVAKAWESGDAQPTLAQLRSVADAMGRPVGFFLTPEPPAVHAALPPDFRSRTGGISPALRRKIRTAQERRDAFRDLVTTSVPWSPPVPGNATSVRYWLGVGLDAIRNAPDAGSALKIWIQAAEDRGALVFQMSGIDVQECRGFSLADAAYPVVMLNGADAAQARSFTLLHELAHVLDRDGGLCLLNDDVDVERRCNRFAAEILMPADAVDEIRRMAAGIDLVDAAVREFRVSQQAAAFRLRDLDLVDASAVSTVPARAAEAARRAESKTRDGGPAHHVLARRNLGERYVSAVLDAMHSDAITVTDATYLLGERIGTVERFEHLAVGAR